MARHTRCWPFATPAFTNRLKRTTANYGLYDGTRTQHPRVRTLCVHTQHDDDERGGCVCSHVPSFTYRLTTTTTTPTPTPQAHANAFVCLQDTGRQVYVFVLCSTKLYLYIFDDKNRRVCVRVLVLVFVLLFVCLRTGGNIGFTAFRWVLRFIFPTAVRALETDFRFHVLLFTCFKKRTAASVSCILISPVKSQTHTQ